MQADQLDQPGRHGITKLFIIGCGPGDEDLLTGKARKLLKTSKRILHSREMPLSVLMEELKKPIETALLVSGDSGFFSVAKMIRRDFSDRYDIEISPGICSVSYFSAKIKIPYDDANLISLHGRCSSIVPKAAYNKKIFALTGGENSVKEICRNLCCYDMGHLTVAIGERLSYPEEKILHGQASDFENMDFDPLSIMYIENPTAANPHIPLRDEDFVREAVPMTKKEVRWLILQKLEILPSDIVFDIGAGSGSVSVEMARRAHEGFVYAVETKKDACALVRKNMLKHGAHNIKIVQGKAPESLEGLPRPNRAFIGGSLGRADAIIEKLKAANPDVKISASAISLQTLHQMTESFAKHGLQNTELICVNIAKSKKTGNYDMMTANNPIYIITGGGHG